VKKIYNPSVENPSADGTEKTNKKQREKAKKIPKQKPPVN
jgi:hypothetical protein